MKLTRHPEYAAVYLSNQTAAQRCQEAIAHWQARNDTIPVPGYAFQWTYQSARTFVRSLSHLFQEYNRVLWQTFHYCRACGGQCCVVDASDVRAFDQLAIALLERTAPVLPQQITAGERACVYLLNGRCSWPEEWRTIKCSSFYCLGIGQWSAKSSPSELRRPITDQLQQLVRTLLPSELRCYEDVHGMSLADALDDPIAFAAALHDALDEIFVGPFNERYPIIDIQQLPVLITVTRRQKEMPASYQLLDDEQVATFIAEAAEQVCETPPPVLEELAITPEQFLADLESLQWIVEGQPSHGPQLLQTMYLRYASAPAPDEGEEPTIWYRMREQLRGMVR